MNNVELARTLSWRENALFEEREKNVFVKPNEQRRACSNIAMARIGNRQHGALSEVERQNALFEEREKNQPRHRTGFCPNAKGLGLLAFGACMLAVFSPQLVGSKAFWAFVIGPKVKRM